MGSRDYSDRPGFDQEDGSCLKCGTGVARNVEVRGKQFRGCNRYPLCNNTALYPRYRFPIVDFLSEDEVMECWAEAELADTDWW